MRSKLLIIVACLLRCAASRADEYVINIPQLTGIHGTAPYTSLDLVIPLPTVFSSIDSATLRLTGEHFPGSVVSVIGNQGGSIGAVLELEDAPPNLPFDSYPYPYFFDQFPVDLHQFSIDERIGAPFQAMSDFRYWLDGTAEFRFLVGPGFINGTMAYSAYPLISIEHAELVISGQPISVPEPPSACLVAFGAGVVLATRGRIASVRNRTLWSRSASADLT